jgi:hypothetical protein
LGTVAVSTKDDKFIDDKYFVNRPAALVDPRPASHERGDFQPDPFSCGDAFFFALQVTIW